MKNNEKPGGIILLGGKSKRMGTDKYLLPFFNVTLIERLVAELEKTVQEVILITNEPEKLSFLPHKKYPDHYAISSALTGLHSGLNNSAYRINFVLACDLPLFDAHLIPCFQNHLSKSLIAIPQTDRGYEALCGLYSKECLPEIETMFHEKNYAIHDLYRRVNTTVIPVQSLEALAHPHVFFNMNTPEDYSRALQLAKDTIKKADPPGSA